MINERSIINFFIILAGAILGPYMIVSFLENDFVLPAIFMSICMVCIIFFTVKDRMAVLPLVGTFIVGNSHILPGRLGFMEVFCLALILYYLVAYLALRKMPLHLGYWAISLPIFIVGLIVLYHDRNFGLKALNSTNMGSRPGLILLVVTITYFCGLSVSSPSVKVLRRLPLFCCLAALLSSMPFLITTIFPSLTPYLYIFTDNVNVGAYVNEATPSFESQEGIGRLGVFAGIGGALQLYFVSQYPLFKWWHPKWSWIAIISFICFVLTAMSGYRNSVFSFMLVTVVGAWCYYSWRAAVIPMILAFAVLLFIGFQISGSGNSSLRNLPHMVQRSLSFLPGDWDNEVLESSKSSNDFRKNIIKVYEAEYMTKSPLIGNGFVMDPEEVDYYNGKKSAHLDSNYREAKGFIVSKAFHTGWISLYDCVGLIGSIGFVMLGINLIWILGSMISNERSNPTPLFGIKAWLFCMMVASFISYFTVFGDFNATFASYCLIAIILYHIMKIESVPQIESPI